MGLQDRLSLKGSTLSAHDGATPSINPLAMKSSKLHAYSNGGKTEPGYSLDGGFAGDVITAYNRYEDGVINNPPSPSSLDLNGKKPKGYTNPETGATYP